MTRTAFAFLTIAAVAGVPVSAQTPTGSLVPTAGGPVVQLGLARRDADGRVLGSASSTGDAAGDDLTGIVFLAPCQSTGASSNLRPPAAATDVWQLGGRIVSLDAEEAVVAVTWQRVRNDGSDVNDEAHAETFRLGMGERRTLETITIPPRGSCPERTSSLDVAYTRRPVATRLPGGGLSSVRVGSGAGAGTPAAGASAGSASGAGGASAVGGAAAGGSSNRADLRRPTADLWLVQSAPGVADRIHHLRTEVSVFPRASTFPRTTIATARGTVTVDVECFVEDGLTPEGEARLFVSASRIVTFVPSSGQARDHRPIVESSIKTAIERPGPDEVVEFELPPVEYPGAPAVPDRFAIRLRLVPRGD